jgi:nitrogen fixation protein FixH
MRARRGPASAATRWILIIVGLLIANVVAMTVLVLASSSSRPRVIPDYYAKATRYDDVLDEAARSRALGWRIDRVAVGVDRELSLEVRDAAGAPLDGARVRVTAIPRAAVGYAELPLELAARGAGRYGVPFGPGTGLHDVTIVVERGAARFTTRVAVEP